MLKTGGEGIKDRSRCRVRQVIDAAHLLLEDNRRSWTVEQTFFDGHVASGAWEKTRVEWIFSK